MDRRAFVQSAGVIGVALLAGCTGGGTFVPSGVSSTPQVPVSQTATLTINFDTPVVVQKSVLPDATTMLVVRGYNSDGSVVYGPEEMPTPPNNVLVLEVPVTMTTVEIVGLAPAPPV